MQRTFCLYLQITREDIQLGIICSQHQHAIARTKGQRADRSQRMLWIRRLKSRQRFSRLSIEDANRAIEQPHGEQRAVRGNCN
jgi:hypothetical protein